MVTNGVQNLRLAPEVMNALFRKAEALLPGQAFLVFEPQGSKVVVGDGDGKRLDTLDMALPEKLWVLTDDYGERFIVTALLPREY